MVAGGLALFQNKHECSLKLISPINFLMASYGQFFQPPSFCTPPHSCCAFIIGAFWSCSTSKYSLSLPLSAQKLHSLMGLSPFYHFHKIFLEYFVFQRSWYPFLNFLQIKTSFFSSFFTHKQWLFYSIKILLSVHRFLPPIFSFFLLSTPAFQTIYSLTLSLCYWFSLWVL